MQTPITKARFWKKRFDTKTPYFYFFIPFSDDQNLYIYIYIYIYIFFFQQKLPSQFILSYYASPSFCLNVVFFVPPKQTNMHDRKQYLRVGSEMSGMRKSTEGVLQVSILGPALFNVYINDLPGIPDYCSLKSYVDDSKLHLTFPVKAIDTPTRQITEDLKKDFSRGAFKIAF